MVVEIQDKYTASRHYTATLGLRGWEWKLTGLSISHQRVVTTLRKALGVVPVHVRKVG